MGFKKFLIKLYLSPFLPKDRVNFYQEIIRNAEWEAVKSFITPNSKFLDVGCGAGFTLMKARDELDCEVRGIDPFPGAHGVHRSNSSSVEIPMDKGVSENLPYGNESFDIVFSSHVLEHVSDADQSLSEMRRVMKKNGMLIIGMPTAAMAWISMFTQILFTTHIRWYNFFTKPFFSSVSSRFKFLFLPESHSAEGKTILHDVTNYRVKKWRDLLVPKFKIEHTILPALYSYPDFPQLFRLHKGGKYASSVFFICSKKES